MNKENFFQKESAKDNTDTQKKAGFFEGWYLKHQKGKRMISFIPAFHRNDSGEWSASIQVITESGSYAANYPIEETQYDSGIFNCKIGRNQFSDQGIVIDLEIDTIVIKGKLSYGKKMQLKSDIMGPFQWISFLQCNHGVISMAHSISGILQINDTMVDFTGGTGYIEKDWGTSFPKTYLWSQCNWKGQRNSPNCVMVSVADIPILKEEFYKKVKKKIAQIPFIETLCDKVDKKFDNCFMGCISVVYYDRKTYRFATYLGTKIIKCTPTEVILKQGSNSLELCLLEDNGFTLQAPSNGCMSRRIYESPACRVQYRFQRKGKLLFQITSDMASFEVVKE